MRDVLDKLKGVIDLLFSRSSNEATDLPFWYVADTDNRGQTTMVSHGIWFSREAAEKHLATKAHWYEDRSFVYCASAHESYGGLRELYRLAEEAKRALESALDLPKIVVLCGSTRFAEAFVRENLRLTIEGVIVLSIGANVSDASLGIGQDSDTKAKLDELHLRKIDLADEVLVLNVGGYIGESTRREIDYAKKAGRPIRYLEEVPVSWER